MSHWHHQGSDVSVGVLAALSVCQILSLNS